MKKMKRLKLVSFTKVYPPQREKNQRDNVHSKFYIRLHRKHLYSHCQEEEQRDKKIRKHKRDKTQRIQEKNRETAKDEMHK